MDPMDIDPIVDVPDTPDRLAAGNIKDKSSIEKGGNYDKSGIRLKANEKGTRKFSIQAPRSLGSSTSHNSINSAFASGNSSHPNFPAFRSSGCNDFPRHGNSHAHYTKSDTMPNSLSPFYQEGSVEGVIEQHGHSKAQKKVVPCRLPGGSQAGDNGKTLLSTITLQPPQYVPECLGASQINKVKETSATVPAFDRGKGVDYCAQPQPKVGKIVFPPPNSTSSSRVSGQKRLVRNGCISPSNIAKAQQVAGKGKNGIVDDGSFQNLGVSSTNPQVRVPVANIQTSSLSKGKEIMTHPVSIREPAGQSANTRDIVCISEIVKEGKDNNKATSRNTEDLGGWRSTRRRSNKVNLSEEHQLLAVDQDTSSSASPPIPPLRQRLTLLSSQVDRINGDHPVTDVKKQEQASSSSIQANCSGEALDDSGIVFLGSSGDTSKLRPCRGRRRNRGDIERVIQIGDSISEVKGDGSNGASSSNREDAKARQIETDEILARELQEQLYSEDSGFSVGEIDAQEAFGMQQDNVQNAFPRRTRNTLGGRSSLIANSTRPPRINTPTYVPRAGSQTRASIQNRMDRFRNRFPGRPRTLSSSRERNSMFPPDMDIDLRMSILEALEAFNDMGVDNNFLEINREFNENDYEMLLALDENNHQHSGTSTSRIDGLPQSTVQNDNFDEACAICLETPTTGDIIRHLPCLHKFHKDCIDPWLRRKNSCPVCKSSIT